MPPGRGAEKVAAQITSEVVRDTDGDPLSIERGVRQRLADKISDTMVGLWLLVAGTSPPGHVGLALRLDATTTACGSNRVWLCKLVHEAALVPEGSPRATVRTRCAASRFSTAFPSWPRTRRCITCWTATRWRKPSSLQVALGKIRRVSGRLRGKTAADRPPSAVQLQSSTHAPAPEGSAPPSRSRRHRCFSVWTAIRNNLSVARSAPRHAP